MTKIWLRAENGRLSKVLEFASGQRVEIPLNRDGSIKWLEDKMKEERQRETNNSQ